ncbi:MAG: NAD-dependent epimerase/dehydratase family protein [Thermoplasmatales archaeon]
MDDSEKMNILLTGNKGFIGTEIEKSLLRSGIKYTGMDQNERVPDDKFDIILHFGARTLIRESTKNPYGYFKDNVDFTLKILEKCRVDGSTIVFPTSGSVMEATNPYSLSKKQGEEWIRLYGKIYNVKSYILKLFNVYGETSKKGAVYLFCKAAVRDEEVKIFGDGNHKRDFIYVGDLVHFLLEIVNGRIQPGDYEIGTGRPVAVNELLSIVERISEKKLKVEHLDYVLPEAEELYSKSPVIRNPLKLESGVRKVYDHLKLEGK